MPIWGIRLSNRLWSCYVTQLYICSPYFDCIEGLGVQYNLVFYLPKHNTYNYLWEAYIFKSQDKYVGAMETTAMEKMFSEFLRITG